MVSLLVLAPLALTQGQTRPPTLDPTYGFPLPTHQAKTQKAPPDADWIWTRETKDNQTVFFRKLFDVAKMPNTAKLYITADDFFTVYLNGKEVGASGPETGNDFVWRKVRSFDVKGFLNPGQNLIAVVARNVGGPAGLLARLEADGKPILFSDNSWHQWQTEPGDGWLLPNFKEVDYTGALRITAVGGEPWGDQISAWPAPVQAAAPYLYHLPLKATAFTLLPDKGSIDSFQWQPSEGKISVDQPQADKDWEICVDFGEELDGRVQVQSGSDVQAQVGTGESAQESIVRPWTTTTMDLVPGKAAYSNYTALRYVALTFPASANHVDLTVSMDHLYYPVAYKGSFDCSDPLLTKIWYMGAYTAHSCMQEDIWDAPKRDRARWMGDLHVSGEVINNIFADKFLMEQTMTRLRDEAQGGRPMTDQPKQNVNGIPGYSCAWVCGLADFYRHVGDLDYIKKQHDGLISMLEYLRGDLDENGVFANKHGNWAYTDWAPEFNDNTPQSRIATHLFMIKAAHEAAFLFKSMGDDASAAKYAEWSDQLTAAAQAHLLTQGLFTDRRQANAMAVYSGAANADEQTAIWDDVLHPGSAAWGYVATPYYNNYVIFAMSLLGHTQEAVDFVRTYWGGMLAEGATSCWEGYDPSWEKDNFHAHLQADNGTGYFVSLCHGWSAGCTNLLTERVLGVRPTSGGFKTCVIEPELGDLAWASGNVPTPGGTLKVRAEKDGMTLTVPSGVSATVGLIGSNVTVNGKAAGEKGPDPRRVYVVFGKGQYQVRVN